MNAFPVNYNETVKLEKQMKPNYGDQNDRPKGQSQEVRTTLHVVKKNTPYREETPAMLATIWGLSNGRIGCIDAGKRCI